MPVKEKLIPHNRAIIFIFNHLIKVYRKPNQ